MAKIYQGISDLVGRTPLVEAARLEKKLGLKAKLLLKLEYLNPAVASRTGWQRKCWKTRNAGV